MVFVGGVAEWTNAAVLPAKGGKTVMAVTYILFSESRNMFYVGSSRGDSAESRLMSHNAGRVRSTKLGRPWKVIAVEKFNGYTEARKRELFLKTGVGRKWISERFGDLKNS